MSVTALSHRKSAYASACTGSCMQGYVKKDTVCCGMNCGF